jgi:hypothetical protein
LNIIGEISIPVIISVFSAICAIASSYAVVRFQAARLDERCEALGRELGAFKIEAVQRFVSDEMLAKVETRISDAINRLADRLDKVLDARASSSRRTP